MREEFERWLIAKSLVVAANLLSDLQLWDFADDIMIRRITAIAWREGYLAAQSDAIDRSDWPEAR